MASKASREKTSEKMPPALGSPFARCSRVTSRDSPKWRTCLQATESLETNVNVWEREKMVQGITPKADGLGIDACNQHLEK